MTIRHVQAVPIHAWLQLGTTTAHLNGRVFRTCGSLHLPDVDARLFPPTVLLTSRGPSRLFPPIRTADSRLIAQASLKPADLFVRGAAV